MPGAREMPAATTVASVRSGELRAGAGVEHMRGAVELMLEGLLIGQTDGSSPRNRPETPFECPTPTGNPPAPESAGQPPLRMTALTPKILEDEPNPRGVGHLAAIVGQGEHGGIDTKRAERVIPIRGLAESYVGRLGRFIPFIDRHAHRTGYVARVEHRLIARIEIAYWAEREECSGIDEGIVRHGGLSCER